VLALKRTSLNQDTFHHWFVQVKDCRDPGDSMPARMQMLNQFLAFLPDKVNVFLGAWRVPKFIIETLLLLGLIVHHFAMGSTIQPIVPEQVNRQ